MPIQVGLRGELARGVPICQLSGGQKARVAFARLIVAQADILFLDEPSNNLDVDTLEVNDRPRRACVSL
jgi:ABC transport system ATP-binding/permease protein